jgi:hypothetical protein
VIEALSEVSSRAHRHLTDHFLNGEPSRVLVSKV